MKIKELKDHPFVILIGIAAATITVMRFLTRRG